METGSIIARNLLQINAIKLSPQKPFTWASGLKSPLYCDNRIALSYPAVRRLIIDGFAALSERYRPFELIAGVATAGIPHGVLLAERLDLPFAYVRSKAKEHGRENLIEGVVKAGQRVLVIEDLISTGGSSVRAVDALKLAGCEVSAVLAIFSYGFEKADLAFAEADCPFDTLSNYEILIREAIDQAYITPADLQLLRDWRKDPGGWRASRS